MPIFMRKIMQFTFMHFPITSFMCYHQRLSASVLILLGIREPSMKNPFLRGRLSRWTIQL